MSLIQELEDLIRRTGSYKDRETLQKVLEQLKKDTRSATFGYFDEVKPTRR